MFSLESVPKPHPQVVSRLVDDEAVLVLPHTGKVKVLNKVGGRIWELSDGKRSVKEIACIIHQEYKVTLEVAEADTLAFLKELAERDMFQDD